MSSLTLRALRLGLGWLAVSPFLLPLPVIGAETKAEGPLVEMAPFEVVAMATSVKVRPFYRKTPDGPRLEVLAIEQVKANSAAERVGLKAGMEILALDGRDVIGMSEEEYAALWEKPFWNSVTLKVITPKRFGHAKPQEIRVPLPSEPLPSVRVSFPAESGKKPSGAVGNR